MKIDEIIERVKKSNEIPYFRPDTFLSFKDYPILVGCIRLCWSELPESRPKMKEINNLIKKSQAGLELNIVDNIVKILEKYTLHLEEIVDNRTKELVREKLKSEQLLLRILPKSVAEQLKTGYHVKTEKIDNVSICFCDIVGKNFLPKKMVFYFLNNLNNLNFND